MRGIVLTLDIAISLTLLLVVIATAYAAYGSPSRAGFDSQLMRSYLQDTATVMSNLGYFSSPTTSSNGTNTTGMREVLRATPSSVCMQVSGFGTAVGSDLAAYYKFDEDSGGITSDSSGNGHVGTIYNGNSGSLSGLGKSGHALTTSNKTDYMDTGYDLSWNDNTQVSIAFWLKPASTEVAYAGIIGKPEREWAFYQNNRYVIFTYLDNGGGHRNRMDCDWGSVLTRGAWVHLAYVWDGRESTMYVNGEPYQTCRADDPAMNLDDPSDVLVGGNIQVGNSGDFEGSIDELRFYSRALNATEVKLIYSNPSNLLYVVDKPECAYGGGEVQSLTVPFVSNANQEQDEYYYATLKAWPSGASK